MSEDPTEIRPMTQEQKSAMADLGLAAAKFLQVTVVEDLGPDFRQAYQADRAKLIVEIALPDHACKISAEWPEFREGRFEIKRLIPGKLKHDA